MHLILLINNLLAVYVVRMVWQVGKSNIGETQTMFVLIYFSAFLFSSFGKRVHSVPYVLPHSAYYNASDIQTKKIKMYTDWLAVGYLLLNRHHLTISCVSGTLKCAEKKNIESLNSVNVNTSTHFCCC